jgi:hypothetical protein
MVQGGPSLKKDFDKTYMTFSKVPKYWISTFFQRVFPTVMTNDVLHRVDSGDRQNIRSLFKLFTGTTDSTKWPQCAKDQDVLYWLMVELTQSVGPRVTEEWLKCVSIAGMIDWSKGGPYTLSVVEQEGAKVVKLSHITGVHVTLPVDMVTAEMVKDKKCEVHDPIHERSAFLKVNGFNLQLHEQFPVGVGPNADPVINEKGKWIANKSAEIAEKLRKSTLVRVWSSDGVVAQAAQELEVAFLKNDEERRAIEALKRKEALKNKPHGHVVKKMKVAIS